MNQHPENELLLRLQHGISLTERPFSVLGQSINWPEQQVLSALQLVLADGRGRRFGAIFDPAQLGYVSTLAAVSVPAQDLSEKARLLSTHSGVTHCYSRYEYRTPLERQSLPNLWFTLQERRSMFPSAWQEATSYLAPYQPVSLPMIRRYKIRAVFQIPGHLPHACWNDYTGAPSTACGYSSLSDHHRTNTGPDAEEDWRIVAALQDTIPLIARPFLLIADRCGMKEDALLNRLNMWQKTGLLRRLALVVRHQRFGLAANGLALWRTEHPSSAGMRLAMHPEVTHCYERAVPSDIPGNLFAMLHATTLSALAAQFEDLSKDPALGDGVLLISGEEFKKTSLCYQSMPFTQRGNPAEREALIDLRRPEIVVP